MRSSSVLLSAASAIGVMASSSAVASSPVFVAQLPDVAYDTAAYPDGDNAIGRIWARSSASGKGVDFRVFFANLPATGGPFLYHIHAKRVPDDGNCTATGAHLDPYNRTETPSCNPKFPAECQVGDLSGKHGKITTSASDDDHPFEVSYTDLYASTDPASPAYFGDLSFVLHFANKTRISCANFDTVLVNGTDHPHPTSSSSVTVTPYGQPAHSGHVKPSVLAEPSGHSAHSGHAMPSGHAGTSSYKGYAAATSSSSHSSAAAATSTYKTPNGPTATASSGWTATTAAPSNVVVAGAPAGRPASFGAGLIFIAVAALIL